MYKDIYINTTNVNFPAHKKLPNITLWFCATQQITETTKHANSCKQKIPNTFLHLDVIPSKNRKKLHSAKSKITYTTKKFHSAIQMLFQYKGFFNFAQNNIGTTPFFTTK